MNSANALPMRFNAAVKPEIDARSGAAEMPRPFHPAQRPPFGRELFAEIAQDLARGIVPWYAGDTSTWVAGRPAHIHPFHWSAVVGVMRDRAPEEDLVETHLAMMNVTTGHREHLLDV